MVRYSKRELERVAEAHRALIEQLDTLPDVLKALRPLVAEAIRRGDYTYDELLKLTGFKRPESLRAIRAAAGVTGPKGGPRKRPREES